MLFEKAITVENPCSASFVLCSSRFEYHKYCGVSLTVIRTNTSNKQASSGATNAIGHFCSFPHNSGKGQRVPKTHEHLQQTTTSATITNWCQFTDCQTAQTD
ncbi:hypothetical protein T03_15863 [Trichinella britovi]|uniref:Uncharacterized protein n=1 Tax=Trichinella britovi TaxID=45882 RepID=A0A0V1D8G6_TRIBR|nr:hypothetical protein T03_15863 [Trichinella britovi]